MWFWDFFDKYKSSTTNRRVVFIVKKTFTQIGIDTQYGTIGFVYSTEDEQYKIIDVDTLNTLQKQIDSLKQSQAEAYFRGNIVRFNSDKISGAVSVVTRGNVETSEVIVSKRAIEDLLQSNNAGNVNSSVIINLNNQIRSLKSQIESLKEENKSLKQNPSKVAMKDMQKQLDVAIPKLKEANIKNKKLREELERKDMEVYRLKNTSTEVEELYAKVADLQKKLEASKSSVTNRMSKAREVKMKKSDQTASLIIGLAVQRYDVGTIQQILSTKYNKDVKLATIYRAMSVREDNDRQRISNLYAKFPEAFQGVTKEEVIRWFETNRIKKLHLVSKEDFIKKYGEAALPARDPFITEDYYSEKNM